MKCSAEKLSALLDGDLGGREAARVRGHVDGCADCRQTFGELGALRTALSAQSADPPLPAPSVGGGDGWAQLAARLGSTPEPRRRFRLGWVLAPASLAVMLVGVGFWLRHHRAAAPSPSDDQLIAQAETEFRGAEAQYQRALDKLRMVSDNVRKDWPAARRQKYDAAHATLEAAVEKCRSVARAQPADPDAEELLFAAYGQQIDFVQAQLLDRPVLR